MSCPKKRIVFVCIMMFLGMTAQGLAADYSEKDVSVRKLGVAYNMADDRQMENIAGVYQPEGLDKYMKRYFDQLSSKIDSLSSKIDKLNEQVGQMSALLAKKDAAKSVPQGKII